MEPLVTHVPVEQIIRGQEALSFIAAAPKLGAAYDVNGRRVR